jgi:anti-sigma factor RsiW
MTCEDAHLHMHDFISGELAPEIRDSLFDHFEACENCRNCYYEASRMAVRVGNLLQSQAPPELRSAISSMLAGA